MTVRSDTLPKLPKIAIVTPSFSGGGAERVAVNLANYYSSLGHTVILIAVQDHGPYRIEVSSSVLVVDLHAKRLRFAAFPLIKALGKIQPDAVLSVIRRTNVLLGLASLFIRFPSLVFREANTLDGIRTPTLYNRLMLLAMRLAYRRASCIVANSQDTSADLMASRVGSPKKMKVIGNPVVGSKAPDLFAAGPTLPWQDEHIRLILSVGRLAPQKRHDLTMRAFGQLQAKHPDVRLLIIGEGSELHDLRQLQEELSLSDSVAFLPFQQNLYPFYKAADVFVLSSDWEGFGNVLVEALSAGTTIVSTNCPGGPKEILDDGKFGHLVPVRDAEALADAISRALDHPLQPELLEGRAACFSIETIAQRYGEALFGPLGKN